jgi:hypothetical protein
MVERLPSKFKDLGSNLNTAKIKQTNKQTYCLSPWNTHDVFLGLRGLQHTVQGM